MGAGGRRCARSMLAWHSAELKSRPRFVPPAPSPLRIEVPRASGNSQRRRFPFRQICIDGGVWQSLPNARRAKLRSAISSRGTKKKKKKKRNKRKRKRKKIRT